MYSLSGCCSLTKQFEGSCFFNLVLVEVICLLYKQVLPYLVVYGSIQISLVVGSSGFLSWVHV